MSDPAPAAPAAPQPAAAKPAAAAPAKPAAPPAPPKDFRSDEMRRLFARIQGEQKRLGWSDAKLAEFANQVLAPTDPYKKVQITTVDLISRLRARFLTILLEALAKAR